MPLARKYAHDGKGNSHECFTPESANDPEWAAKNPCHPMRNFHPTVKPTALLRYLCRLITPPGGVVLDPFMGSGSTGKAAILEGFRFAGIEIDPAYLAIATARIRHALRQPPLPFESARDAARQAIATEAAE